MATWNPQDDEQWKAYMQEQRAAAERADAAAESLRQQEETAEESPEHTPQHSSKDYHKDGGNEGYIPRHAEPEYEPKHGKEPDGTDDYGPSARDDIRDRLGLNGKHRATPEEDPGGLYRGKHENDGRKQLNKLFKSDSGTKKKLAIAGAAAGGSAVLGIVIFLAMLPLKIESLVNNLENKFSAEATQALGKETGNLERNFITKHVLPNLGKGTCHSTLDASCVSAAKGSSPFAKVYNAWREGRTEQLIAKKGYLIGKNNTGYYLSINGNYYGDTKTMDSQIKEVLDGKRSFFDLSGDNKRFKVSRTELRSQLKYEFKNGTFWDKTYNRFKVGRLLETKYGVKRCIFFCNIRDKFADFVADKKFAGKAILWRRLVEPFSQSRSLVLGCVLVGGDACDISPSKPTDNLEDPERISPFEKDLRTKLLAYEAEFGTDKLAKIVEAAKGISKDGLQKYMIKKLAQKIVEKAGGGDAAKALAADQVEKFIPVAGWVKTAASIIDFLGNAGPKLRALNYAVYAPLVVSTFAAFITVTHEMHTGHIDPTALGSLTDTLNNGGVDASTTPMWAKINGTPTVTTTSFLTDLLPGSAYAATILPSDTNTPYRCADGKGVKPTQLVCDEEIADGGIGGLNNISDAVRSIPGWSILNSLSGLVGTVADKFNGFVGDIVDHIPVVSQAMGLIGKLGSLITGGIFGIIETMIPNPLEDAVANGKSPKQATQNGFLNLVSPKAYAADTSTGDGFPSGGRLYDLMVAGADMTYNNSCQVDLGCAAVTDQQVADAQNAQQDQDKAEFESRPLFARMFSTDTPYSLVSRIAITMPTNMLTATNNSISTLFTNPIARLGTLFSTALSGSHAFAAVTASKDAFHIPQVGYVGIPDNDEAFWEANCVTGPLGKYDAAKDIEDVSDWVNSQPVDEDTGQAIPAPGHQNPCLLIHAAIQGAGVSSDPKMIPADDQNSDAAAAAAAEAASQT